MLAQNLATRPQAVAFRLEGLEGLSARVNYRPQMACAVAPGASCPFELVLTLPPPQARGDASASGVGSGEEYHGALVLSTGGSQGGVSTASECCRCSVYLRAVPLSAEALAAPEGPPRLLPAGSLSWRAHCSPGLLEAAARAPVPVGRAICIAVPVLYRCAELIAPLPIQLSAPPSAGAVRTRRIGVMLSPTRTQSPTRIRTTRTQAAKQLSRQESSCRVPLAGTTRSAGALSLRCRGSQPASDRLGSGGAATTLSENRLAM